MSTPILQKRDRSFKIVHLTFLTVETVWMFPMVIYSIVQIKKPRVFTGGICFNENNNPFPCNGWKPQDVKGWYGGFMAGNLLAIILNCIGLFRLYQAQTQKTLAMADRFFSIWQGIAALCWAGMIGASALKIGTFIEVALCASCFAFYFSTFVYALIENLRINKGYYNNSRTPASSAVDNQTERISMSLSSSSTKIASPGAAVLAKSHVNSSVPHLPPLNDDDTGLDGFSFEKPKEFV